jgi:hypothetical protein
MLALETQLENGICAQETCFVIAGELLLNLSTAVFCHIALFPICLLQKWQNVFDSFP